MKVTAAAALNLAKGVLAGRKKGHLVLVDLARYVVSLHDGKADLEGALARLRDAGPLTLSDEEIASRFPNVKLPERRTASLVPARETHPLTHVAIRHGDQIWSLPSPYRHHHVIGMIADLTGATRVQGDLTRDQGFLDSNGRYLDREEALPVAKAHGQLKGGKIIGGVLTSEDLW